MEFDGIKVVDSTKPLKINITDEDVRLGSVQDPTCCAAALAIIREYRAAEARVHLGRTYVLLKKKWLRYETPPSLRDEIIAFDRGGEFVPGEHVLGRVRPSHFVGKSGKAPRYTRRGPVKAKPRAKHVVPGVRYSAVPT